MKLFSGIVVGKKMDKTATVAVDQVIAHPVYEKRVRKVKKYQVHDDVGVKVGERVEFVASKPYSKTKRWKIVRKAGGKKK